MNRKQRSGAAEAALTVRQQSPSGPAGLHQSQEKRRASLEKADEVLPDRLEEIRFARPEKGELQRWIPHERAQHPTHLTANQRKKNNPPAKDRAHVCPGRLSFDSIEGT